MRGEGNWFCLEKVPVCTDAPDWAVEGAVFTAQIPAESIVVGSPTRARTTDGAIRTVRACGSGGRRSNWNRPGAGSEGSSPERRPPAVLYRFIQQAVTQVLQEDREPGIPGAIYGFWPGRSAH